MASDFDCDLCFNYGDISASPYSTDKALTSARLTIGGVVGSLQVTNAGHKINNCANLGDITAESYTVEVGGILCAFGGTSPISLSNCFSKCNISVKQSSGLGYVGGGFGDMYKAGGVLDIENVYVLGTIKVNFSAPAGASSYAQPLICRTAVTQVLRSFYYDVKIYDSTTATEFESNPNATPTRHEKAYSISIIPDAEGKSEADEWFRMDDINGGDVSLKSMFWIGTACGTFDTAHFVTNGYTNLLTA